MSFFFVLVTVFPIVRVMGGWILPSTCLTYCCHGGGLDGVIGGKDAPGFFAMTKKKMIGDGDDGTITATTMIPVDEEDCLSKHDDDKKTKERTMVLVVVVGSGVGGLAVASLIQAAVAAMRTRSVMMEEDPYDVSVFILEKNPVLHIYFS